jgi:hypothetical protein
VPVLVDEPIQRARVVGPAVVRIGPDRTLLDPPWDLVGCAVAHIWPDDAVDGGWARVVWPVDSWWGRPVAPLDLHLGHVLELSVPYRTAVGVRYACVADVDQERMVLVPAASAFDAISMARGAVDVWRGAQLAAAEDAWRERIAAAQRFYGGSI